MASFKKYVKENLSRSEELIRDYLVQHLPDHFDVLSQYTFRKAPRQRRKSKRPDFIVVNSQIGSVIIEIKDYKLETILGFKEDKIKLDVRDHVLDDGCRTHPHLQADEYLDALDVEYQNPDSLLVKRVGNQGFAVGTVVIFTKIRRDEFLNRGYDSYVDMERTLFSDDLTVATGKNLPSLLRKWLGRSELINKLQHCAPAINEYSKLPDSTTTSVQATQDIIQVPESVPVSTNCAAHKILPVQYGQAARSSIWRQLKWAIPAVLTMTATASVLTSRSSKSPSLPPSPPTVTETLVVTAECLFVRDKPSPYATVKGVLPKGTNAHVVSTASNGWKQIETTLTAASTPCKSKPGTVTGFVNPTYATLTMP